MDPLTSPGGFLGGFILAGILLPIALSFVADGVVMYFRGRGPLRLFTTASLSLVIIGLYSLAWQNTASVGATASLAGSIGLILWFSVPAALLGFGARMMALFLNPSTKAQDLAAIAARKERRAQRIASRTAHAAQEVRHA